jgi:hypothetical protein
LGNLIRLDRSKETGTIKNTSVLIKMFLVLISFIQYFFQVRRKTQPPPQENLQNSKSHCTSEPRLTDTETPPQRRRGSQRRPQPQHNAGTFIEKWLFSILPENHFLESSSHSV